MPCNQFPLTQRRKAWGRITILFALIALAITVLPTASFAGTDTAGNVLATDNDANPSGVEGDLYWAGQALNLDDASIDHDIIAAGDTLSIRDCTVGGAVRLAARTIDIAKTTVDGSVTVVGQHVVLNTDSSANCFYAMGETVALRGSAKSAALAGDTVTIDGTVEGNVEVWADKLILGKNAHITGTVNAHVSEDPERAAGAEVGALKIDRTENEDTSTVNDVIGGIVAAALSTCERSSGYDCYRPRRPTADYLYRRSVACRSPHVRCHWHRAGVECLCRVRDCTHGRTQPEPLRHGSRWWRNRRRPHGASPRRRLHQRRGLCLYARLHHPNHLAQRPPQAAAAD